MQNISNGITRKIIILLISLCVILSAAVCLGADASYKLYKGEPVKIGNGTAWSWVNMDNNGNPISIGLSFTKDILSGLPDEDTEYIISIPRGVSVPPFNHIAIDWNPHGHIPVEIYGKPHFDFHFYMIDQKQRDAITVTGDDLARVEMKPDPRYVPADYIQTPGGVPHMGAHWLDSITPELHGSPFTETFIYGFYNGQMIFLEPMVTVSYLNTNPTMSAPVKLPSAYQRSGYYPTRYSVAYDMNNSAYFVSLDGLTKRQAE